MLSRRFFTTAAVSGSVPSPVASPSGEALAVTGRESSLWSLRS